MSSPLSFLFPLVSRLICYDYITRHYCCWSRRLPSPPPPRPLGQSTVSASREFGRGQASHEIIQLTYREIRVYLTLMGSLACTCIQVCLLIWVFLSADIKTDIANHLQLHNSLVFSSFLIPKHDTQTPTRRKYQRVYSSYTLLSVQNLFFLGESLGGWMDLK